MSSKDENMNWFVSFQYFTWNKKSMPEWHLSIVKEIGAENIIRHFLKMDPVDLPFKCFDDNRNFYDQHLIISDVDKKIDMDSKSAAKMLCKKYYDNAELSDFKSKN